MKKITISILVFSFFLFKAQFTGAYNLNDGGTDVSNSNLYIMENHEFYFAGGFTVKKGSWKETSANTIQLEEIRLNAEIIKMYASKNANRTDKWIHLDNLSDASSLVTFNDSNVFFPVFNESANCFNSEYIIKKSNIKTFTIAVPKEENTIPQEVVKPSQYIVYTFELDDKYNDFTVNIDKSTESPLLSASITKKGDKYFISDYEITRKVFSPELLAKVKKNINEVNEIHKNEDLYGSKNSFYSGDKSKISSLSKKEIPTIESDKPSLFFAECKETGRAIPNEKLDIVTGKKNGFYKVIKDKDENKDIPYQLEVQPIIAKQDIINVKKRAAKNSGHIIEFKLTSEAIKKLKQIEGSFIAIVANGKVYKSVYISPELNGGNFETGENYDEEKVDTVVRAFSGK